MEQTRLDPSEKEPQEIYVKTRKQKHLYQGLPYSIIGSIVVALILPTAFGHSVPAWSLHFSMGLIVFLSLLRGALYVMYTRQTNERTVQFWGTLFNTGLFLMSFSWGLLSFIIFPHVHPLQQMLLVLLLAGVISAAIINLSADFILSMIFIQVILVPLTIRFAFTPSEIQIGVILLILTFNAFITFSSYHLSSRLQRSLILEFRYNEANEELGLSEQRFETIFNKAPTGIFYYNQNLVLLESNSGFSSILDFPFEKLTGLDLRDLSDKRVLPALEKILENKNGYYEGPYHSSIAGFQIHITLRTSPIRDTAGYIKGGVAIVEDITEKTRIQQEMRHQAYHDTLTGLPNRQLLLDRLSQTLKSARRHKHKGVLLYMDLDKFKQINDSTGHQAGDQMLKEVAMRLTEVLRQEDTVSRLGGDEFVILLPEITTDDESSVIFTRAVTDKIHKALAHPFHIDGQIFHSTTSIGVLIFNGEEESPETILKYADTAMYHAKDQGRNRTSFFHQEMDAIMQEQVSLEADLHSALRDNKLEIYFQPIVDIPSERICGAEALLRWNHPQKGFISPEKVISMAEKTGQILPLGKWIMEKALSEYTGWTETQKVSLDYISINISIRQMLQPDFVSCTMQSIRNAGIPTERIVLEITESIFITDFDKTVKKMKELRDYGVQFALDDFGTGYSSLSYLKKLPLDKLKIDRSFTENLLTDKNDYALVETIMGIASHFNLTVIAEGVEEAEHVQVLKKMGCPLYQGYFCSKPLNPEDFLLLTHQYEERKRS